VAQKILNTSRLALSQSSDAKTAANKPTRMADHSPEMQKVLDRLARELVEYFESGMVVATFQDGSTTKNAFVKFGNEYAVEGIVANIHDILYGQEDEDDDDLDDGDLKKVIKDG
jgi:hypothetical protein